MQFIDDGVYCSFFWSLLFKPQRKILSHWKYAASVFCNFFLMKAFIFVIKSTEKYKWNNSLALCVACITVAFYFLKVIASQSEISSTFSNVLERSVNATWFYLFILCVPPLMTFGFNSSHPVFLTDSPFGPTSARCFTGCIEEDSREFQKLSQVDASRTPFQEGLL